MHLTALPSYYTSVCITGFQDYISSQVNMGHVNYEL